MPSVLGDVQKKQVTSQLPLSERQVYKTEGPQEGDIKNGSLSATGSDPHMGNRGLLPRRTTHSLAQESGVEAGYQVRPRVRQPG